MKIYINNRNYLTWPKNMAETLLNQGHDVYIVDNNSTYKPLLDWYNQQKDIKIIKLGINGGHKAPWVHGIIDTSDYYVVTDSDLDISTVPNNWDEILISGIKEFNVEKAGLSLSEKNIPCGNPSWILDNFCDYPNGDHPLRWGNHIKLNEMFFNHPIDTTFAVYAPKTRHSISGIRTNTPYTAKHLPWHIVLNKDNNPNEFQIEMDDEIYYYFMNASSVSTTKFRLNEMLKEYGKIKI